MEQGLLAGGEAVLLVSVEQGLIRWDTAEVWKIGSRNRHHSKAISKNLQGFINIVKSSLDIITNMLDYWKIDK